MPNARSSRATGGMGSTYSRRPTSRRAGLPRAGDISIACIASGLGVVDADDGRYQASIGADSRARGAEWPARAEPGDA